MTLDWAAVYNSLNSVIIALTVSGTNPINVPGVYFDTASFHAWQFGHLVGLSTEMSIMAFFAGKRWQLWAKFYNFAVGKT